MSLDECIRYLDENFAKIPENKEVLDIQRAVEDAVSSLRGNIYARDERFEFKLEPSGSFYEGTKIRQADEFDFMISLTKPARFCDIVYREVGRPHALVCAVSKEQAKESGLDSQSWSEFFEEISDAKSWLGQSSSNWSISGPISCLDGSKLKQKFYSLFRESLRCVSWPADHDLKFLTSTGATFDKLGLHGATQASASEKVDFLWKGGLKLSVDLALAIECKQWPSVLGQFDNCTDKQHPAYLLGNKVKSLGCHIVPKLGHIWRISWTTAEMTLLKHIFSQNNEAALSYHVAKLINETYFVQTVGERDVLLPFVPCESYTLKHLLMSMWILCLSTSNRFPRGCGKILVELLQLLLTGFKSGHCQQVFVNGYSTVKEGPLLHAAAVALEKCISTLKTLDGIEKSEVPKSCEDFLRNKETVIIPSPPKKIWKYKIKKVS